MLGSVSYIYIYPNILLSISDKNRESYFHQISRLDSGNLPGVDILDGFQQLGLAYIISVPLKILYPNTMGNVSLYDYQECSGLTRIGCKSCATT